jgi:hypothetical protein
MRVRAEDQGHDWLATKICHDKDLTSKNCQKLGHKYLA